MAQVAHVSVPVEPALLTLAGVAKRYAGGGTQSAGCTLALDGVDLLLRRGEFLALLGPSGCGKSTLLRIIAGLVQPSAGHIEMAPSTEGADCKRIGFVFQDPTLMPWADVMANVRLPLDLAGTPRQQAQAEAAEMIARVGLVGFARAYPRQLSGGMRMRVSLARALVTRPTLLLMDEPFAALDEITRFKLNDDLLALRQASGCTVVFVTHSTYESIYLADRVLVMSARPGRIAAEIAVGPHKRDTAFRASAAYARLCARTFACVEAAAAGRAMPTDSYPGDADSAGAERGDVA